MVHQYTSPLLLLVLNDSKEVPAITSIQTTFKNHINEVEWAVTIQSFLFSNSVINCQNRLIAQPVSLGQQNVVTTLRTAVTTDCQF